METKNLNGIDLMVIQLANSSLLSGNKLNLKLGYDGDSKKSYHYTARCFGSEHFLIIVVIKDGVQISDYIYDVQESKVVKDSTKKEMA